MRTATRPIKRSRWFRVIRIFLGLVLLGGFLFYLAYVLPFWGIPFNGSRHGRVPLIVPGLDPTLVTFKPHWAGARVRVILRVAVAERNIVLGGNIN
jgi:hypothetical protein